MIPPEDYIPHIYNAVREILTRLAPIEKTMSLVAKRMDQRKVPTDQPRSEIFPVVPLAPQLAKIPTTSVPHDKTSKRRDEDEELKVALAHSALTAEREANRREREISDEKIRHLAERVAELEKRKQDPKKYQEPTLAQRMEAMETREGIESTGLRQLPVTSPPLAPAPGPAEIDQRPQSPSPKGEVINP